MDPPGFAPEGPGGRASGGVNWESRKNDIVITTVFLAAFSAMPAHAAPARVGRLSAAPSRAGAAPSLRAAPAWSAAPDLPVLTPLPGLAPGGAGLPSLSAPGGSKRLSPAEAAPNPEKAPAGVLPALTDLAEEAKPSEKGGDASALKRFYDRDSGSGGVVSAGAAESPFQEGDFAEKFRVARDPKGAVDLSDFNSARTPGMKHRREKAADKLEADQKRLDELQQKLYAEGKRSVLIVLQAMDTGGKDGTIRWVLGPLNPQGFKITGFKKPTAQEAKRHYLWRIKKALPGKGIIGVFNRSQYEDILVPTVYKTMPMSEVAGRYDEINAFEKRLADQGVVILKFFLHISKDEQKRRLQDRLDDPKKRWKFSPADLEARKHWDAFQRAYGAILARTSTPWAPWHIIPADKKWYRNYAVGRILREALERMDPREPKADFDPSKVRIPD